MTHIGVISSTKTLQGATNSTCYFRDNTQSKFEGRVPEIVQWIDDYLLQEKRKTF